MSDPIATLRAAVTDAESTPGCVEVLVGTGTDRPSLQRLAPEPVVLLFEAPPLERDGVEVVHHPLDAFVRREVGEVLVRERELIAGHDGVHARV